MNTRTVGATLLAVTVCVASAGAQTFQTVYGTMAEERSEWVDQTSDGGYIVCGYVSNTLPGDRKSLLVKTDLNGIPQWSKTYGIEPSYDWAHGVDPAANGDFLMTGFTNKIGEGGGAYLLRTDHFGSLLWYKTFYYFTVKNSMEETPTGDIILAGNADDYGSIQGASLLKTDSAGVFQWCWWYGGAVRDYGEAVTPTTDGGYMLTAWTESFGAGSFDTYAIKTDAGGSSGCNEGPLTPILGDDQPPVIDVQLIPRGLDLWEDYPLTQTPPGTIEEFLCGGGDDCVTPPPGMVAWWPFDELAAAPQAEEIVNNNDGSYVNGATPGALGMVVNAVDFDGVDDMVVAQDHPTLNFGPSPQGDLTIDAWVYLDTFSVAFAPIVHKRDSDGVGYYFFLLDGNPALYLGDGGGGMGHTMYCCSGPLLWPGQWYHIAVTVDRDNPAGLQYYVDGLPAGAPYDPTDRPGDLTNTHDLLIGAADYEEYPGSAPSYWDGRIDEVEIFGRALSAAEIQAIYAAGAAGKCKETCHVPWDKRFCRYQNTVTATVTICNYDSVDHDYLLSFTGLPAGSLMGCSIDGPTSFTVVGPNPVTVSAGTCVGVPVQIARPIGMTAAHLIGCYEVQIDNLDTGSTMICHGSVVDRRDLCAVLRPIDLDVIAVPIGLPAPVVVELTNTADVALDFAYRIVAYDPDMMPDTQVVSLDDLPPGEPATGTLLLVPDESGALEFTATMLAYEPFRTYDLVIETDMDGDGEYGPLTSVALRGLPFGLGDLNCDGVVDFGDIDPFVQALVGPEGYSEAYPNCSILLADCNGDGQITFDDIDPFVAILSEG